MRPLPAAAPTALNERQIGHEARAASDDHLAVRIWLRLLACSTQIETDIRTRLHQRFDTTLARFDYLAQLQRHPDGLRMNALSRYLMVTGGNVTGLTRELAREGLVERVPDAEDGRAWRVRLTPLGQTQFARMAAEHEGWLKAMFDGFEAPLQQQMYELLGRLRMHLSRPQAGG